ncbi:MAG: hypothetical protein R2754_13410 [Microthrixaceae bacterium]
MSVRYDYPRWSRSAVLAAACCALVLGCAQGGGESVAPKQEAVRTTKVDDGGCIPFPTDTTKGPRCEPPSLVLEANGERMELQPVGTDDGVPLAIYQPGSAWDPEWEAPGFGADGVWPREFPYQAFRVNVTTDSFTAHVSSDAPEGSINMLVAAGGDRGDLILDVALEYPYDDEKIDFVDIGPGTIEMVLYDAEQAGGVIGFPGIASTGTDVTTPDTTPQEAVYVTNSQGNRFCYETLPADTIKSLPPPPKVGVELPEFPKMANQPPESPEQVAPATVGPAPTSTPKPATPTTRGSISPGATVAPSTKGPFTTVAPTITPPVETVPRDTTPVTPPTSEPSDERANDLEE